MKRNLLIASLCLSSSLSYGSYITINNQLSGQYKSHTVDAETLNEGESRVLTNFEQYRDIRLLSEASTYGSGSRFNLSYQYGIRKEFNLGISANLMQESSISRAEEISIPHRKGQFSLDLKMPIIISSLFNLAINPFLEVGSSSRHHFLVRSKDTIGVRAAMSVGLPMLRLTTNLYARYRPLDIHRNYNIGNDWGSSAMLSSQLGIITIYGEVAEQNLRYINMSEPADGYKMLISQKHRVGISIEVKNAEINLFAGKAMKDKIIGSPAREYGLSFSIQLDESSRAPKYEPPVIKKREIHEGMAPGERVHTLDSLREDIKLRNQFVGEEMKGFHLLEEGPIEPNLPAYGEDAVKEADKELHQMADVERRIEEKKKKTQQLPHNEAIPAAISH